MSRKILAFAGSNSSRSINKKLVEWTLPYFEGNEIRLIDLNDFEMPLFSIDREKRDGHPAHAHRFLEEIRTCDFIICSLAEHNRSYSVAFKNIFDWCSRIEVKPFSDKPMLLMSTSPGRVGGGNVMNTATTFLPQFGADIRAHFSLPLFGKTAEYDRGIVDPEWKEKHEAVIERFKESISDL